MYSWFYTLHVSKLFGLSFSNGVNFMQDFTALEFIVVKWLSSCMTQFQSANLTSRQLYVFLSLMIHLPAITVPLVIRDIYIGMCIDFGILVLILLKICCLISDFSPDDSCTSSQTDTSCLQKSLSDSHVQLRNFVS